MSKFKLNFFFQIAKAVKMVKTSDTHFHTPEQRNAGYAFHLDVDAHSHESPQQILREKERHTTLQSNSIYNNIWMEEF